MIEVLLGVGLFCVAMVILYLVVNNEHNKRTINRLREEVFGDFGSGSHSILIGNNRNDLIRSKESLELILKGLPNLYKDDLDLVQKVDYPKSTGRFLTTDTNIGYPIVVVFTGSGNSSSYPVPLANTLRRANEIRNIQEKCCPKKKG